MHRPRQRDVGQVGLRGAGEQPRRVVADVQRGVGVGRELRPLGGGQRRVEHHGDDAGAQRSQDDRQQRRRRRGRDEQPVAGPQTGTGQRRRRAPLVVLALRGTHHRHRRHAGRTSSPATASRPSAASLSSIDRVEDAAAGRTSGG